ncbi:MAG TPA: zinc-binding dehydrogenase [Actinomycetota bacterium]|nr:zinc-binding dehydrogenase [Actinomycetota bacterium]
MLAARVHTWGEPPVVEEVDDPVPRDDEALVRVSVAAVGHVDRDVMSGGFVRHPPLPYVPGVEGAGTVVRSAAVPEGTHVWFRGAGLGIVANGTWSELAAVREVALMPVPEGVAAEVAGTFFSVATSAHVALHDVGEVRAGEHVAVRGAAGAVGSLAAQLAIRAGAADVAGIVSGPDRAVPDGARSVVAGPDLAERVRAGGDGVDLLVDTVGGFGLEDLIPAVAPGGRIVLVGYTAGTRTELDLSRLMQRDVRLLPLNMIRREPAARAAAPGLLNQLARGELSLEVTTFPLADVGRALTALERGTVTGRIALTP